jgi:hypothetical protein
MPGSSQKFNPKKRRDPRVVAGNQIRQAQEEGMEAHDHKNDLCWPKFYTQASQAGKIHQVGHPDVCFDQLLRIKNDKQGPGLKGKK